MPAPPCRPWQPAPAEEPCPRSRPITRGPKFHWFGYYDKLQFDPTGRYVLGMEAAFENRTPLPDDVITVGMIDLADDDRWTPFGESRAWCWQQGCMLQWLPGSRSEVIWNDREGDHFVSHILDVHTRKKRTLPRLSTRSVPTASGRSPRISAACTTGAPATATPACPIAMPGCRRQRRRHFASTWRPASRAWFPFSEAAKIPYPRAAWTGHLHRGAPPLRRAGAPQPHRRSTLEAGTGQARPQRSRTCRRYSDTPRRLRPAAQSPDGQARSEFIAQLIAARFERCRNAAWHLWPWWSTPQTCRSQHRTGDDQTGRRF